MEHSDSCGQTAMRACPCLPSYDRNREHPLFAVTSRLGGKGEIRAPQILSRCLLCSLEKLVPEEEEEVMEEHALQHVCFHGTEALRGEATESE